MVKPEYLAGFFDADGFVGISSWREGQSYGLHVTLTNTNVRVLEAIQTEYGGKIYAKSSVNPKQAHLFQLQWNSIDAKKFLEIIRPFTIVKKEQVELALQFPIIKRDYNVRPPDVVKKQKEIFDAIRSLKHTIKDIPEKYLIKTSEIAHEEFLRKRKEAIALRQANPDWSTRQIGEIMAVSHSMVAKYLRGAKVINI